MRIIGFIGSNSKLEIQKCSAELLLGSQISTWRPFADLFFILGRKWEIFSLIKAACSEGTDELTRKEFMNHEPPFPISILFYTVGREREREEE